MAKERGPSLKRDIDPVQPKPSYHHDVPPGHGINASDCNSGDYGLVYETNINSILGSVLSFVAYNLLLYLWLLLNIYMLPCIERPFGVLDFNLL